MNEVRPINHSFSMQLPTMQIVIDQTSLGLFKECPRKYYYRMIEGWTTRGLNVHLAFGSWFHEACEVYEHSKAFGADHNTALRNAVRHVGTVSWDKVLGKPWDSGHREKNRYTLVRTVIWYLDTYGASNRNPTIILGNGKPAVELTFKFEPKDPETGDYLEAITGERIYFAGHLDSMVDMQGGIFISDRKTTSKRLGPEYFQAYTPDNQFSMYTAAGQWAFNIDVKGVICDAAQVAQNYSRFERQVIYRTQGQLREWFADAQYYIRLMGVMAEQNRWPQNDKSCYRCPYRPICARDPAARKTWLAAEYIRDVWDPSIRRGE